MLLIAVQFLTRFFAGKVVAPLLLALNRAAKEGAYTEKHLYGEKELCLHLYIYTYRDIECAFQKGLQGHSTSKGSFFLRMPCTLLKSCLMLPSTSPATRLHTIIDQWIYSLNTARCSNSHPRAHDLLR